MLIQSSTQFLARLSPSQNSWIQHRFREALRSGSNDPAVVLDGTWHHCSATFDGTFMRVYLDGREIGSLRRPGSISLQRDVPAFIGSSGGVGEYFQGLLDDVRIYDEALSAEQVASLCRAGAEVQQALLAELEKRLGAVYVPGRSFAETLAATRTEALARSQALAAEAQALRQQLTAMETQLKTGRAAIDQLREDRSSRSSDVARLRAELEHLEESCLAEVNAEAAVLRADDQIARIDGEALAAEEETCRTLRQRIEQMGPVNMMALDE